MGWFVVPDTADPELVCRQPCDHPGCAQLRKFDTRKCQICGEGFEAGQRFGFEGDEALHAVCLDNRRSEILELRESGLSYRRIASRVGLSRQRVWKIVNPRRRRSTKRPKPEFPVLLSTGEVARMLSVSVATVRRWDDAGMMRGYYIHDALAQGVIGYSGRMRLRRPCLSGAGDADRDSKRDLVIAMKGVPL